MDQVAYKAPLLCQHQAYDENSNFLAGEKYIGLLNTASLPLVRKTVSLASTSHQHKPSSFSRGFYSLCRFTQLK